MSKYEFYLINYIKYAIRSVLNLDFVSPKRSPNQSRLDSNISSSTSLNLDFPHSIKENRPIIPVQALQNSTLYCNFSSSYYKNPFYHQITTSQN